MGTVGNKEDRLPMISGKAYLMKKPTRSQYILRCRGLPLTAMKIARRPVTAVSAADLRQYFSVSENSLCRPSLRTDRAERRTKKPTATLITARAGTARRVPLSPSVRVGGVTNEAGINNAPLLDSVVFLNYRRTKCLAPTIHLIWPSPAQWQPCVHH
jgi:hypothetical protein